MLSKIFMIRRPGNDRNGCLCDCDFLANIYRVWTFLDTWYRNATYSPPPPQKVTRNLGVNSGCLLSKLREVNSIRNLTMGKKIIRLLPLSAYFGVERQLSAVSASAVPQCKQNLFNSFNKYRSMLYAVGQSHGTSAKLWLFLFETLIR